MNTPAPRTSPTKTSQRAIAFIELIAFVAIALISKELLDPLFWRYSAPVSLIGTLLLLTGYMRLRGQSWRDMGLPRLPDRRAKLMLVPKVLLTFVAFCICVATVILGGEALDLKFMSEIPEGVEDRFGDIYQNLPQLMLWLGIIWTSAAFGEEMFFRGFVITRLMDVFADVRFASVFSVVLAAALFGYGHYYYQGLRGFIVTGAVAIAFGTMFLVFKRNLWPLIIIHGLIDTLGFVSTYMGWEDI